MTSPNALLESTESVFLPPDFEAPSTVDLNVNGVCNLNCSWCWGPEHSPGIETMTTEDWQMAMSGLRSIGTKDVVFTGGEPLMKAALPELAESAKGLGFRTTLSTNGILLPKRHASVLPSIDDIGLPLDGPDQQTNDAMRRPLGNRSLHFSRVLESLKIVQTVYPSIELTVRTVVGKPNIDKVHEIGDLLLSAGVEPDNLRWKLYQCNPTGPRVEKILADDWLVDEYAFDDTVEKVRTENPQFTHVTGQKVKDSAGRYFFVYPDGETAVTLGSDRVSSEGIPLNDEVSTGNIVSDFAGTMRTLWVNGFRTTKSS